MSIWQEVLFDITSQQDGVSAGAWLQAEEGTYTIVAGEGSAGGTESELETKMLPEQLPQDTTEENTTSIKGMKASAQIVLKGGTYTVDTEDDAFHSTGILLSVEVLTVCHRETMGFMQMGTLRFPEGV